SEEIINEPIVISDEFISDESQTTSPGNSPRASDIMNIPVDKNSIWASSSVINISNSGLKAAIERIVRIRRIF
ncbi:Hypothetical protein CINCED_3A010336, partial [Cinara cedri]